MTSAAGILPFRPRAPWWGGDLQTLRNIAVGHAPKPPGDAARLHLPMRDGSGDRLAALLSTPERPASAPLIVLIHGLTGCEESSYILESASFFLKRRYRVLRLNLRGAGPSRATCSGHYHAGCADDVRDALRALDAETLAQGLFLVGFSLGGNVLINLLALRDAELPIVAAASVSAPIEPARAAVRIMSLRNAPYHAWLLNRMKLEAMAPGAALTERERQAVEAARDIYAYDDGYIAPRNGFAGADDYYTRTAGAAKLADVDVPLLLIHARNDPWIPVSSYDAVAADTPGNVTVELTPGGGHVGFHAGDSSETWHDRRIEAFLQSI